MGQNDTMSVLLLEYQQRKTQKELRSLGSRHERDNLRISTFNEELHIRMINLREQSEQMCEAWNQKIAKHVTDVFEPLGISTIYIGGV
mmetsp:Transcript_90846/g.229007  ORF Transcript_90846/g.229007 Transcript_90846/m.229007 type:complete len:88 (-) Transcript_90846:3-266(-)